MPTFNIDFSNPMSPEGIVNALHKQRYEKDMRDLERKFAEPNMQSDLLKKNIENKYLEDTLKSQNAFRNASAQNLQSPLRVNSQLSAAGKLQYEPWLLSQINEGNIDPYKGGAARPGIMKGPAPYPGQQEQITAEGPSQIDAYYAAQRQKKTSDPQTRQKSNYAKNIEKTIARIDPSIFSDYAGIEGFMNLSNDQLKSLQNENPKAYEKYNNFVSVQVPILTSQIRQFYGESIQPEVRQELESIANPITWRKNPKLALSQFNELTSLLRNEMETYTSTLNAPIKPYEKSIPKEKENLVINKEQIKKLSNVNDQALQETAKKHGMTVEEVKKQLGL